MQRVPVLAPLLVLIAGTAVTQATAVPAKSTSYIVVLDAAVADPAEVASKHGKQYGFSHRFVYRNALKGYAAELSEDEVTALRSVPEVAFVQEDWMVSIAQAQPKQAVSFGVLRIDGDESSAISGDGRGKVKINVAILDTGIATTHPDLRAKEGIDCVPRDPEIDLSHGTMVGGFVGALDNGIGRVGVAPGATLWSVRVFDSTGFGFVSEIVCGIDWVTSTLTDRDPHNDIAVANYSGSSTPEDPFHQEDDPNCGLTNGNPEHLAICNLAAAGVPYVAATGNESETMGNPAVHQEVLAVTAMADADGQAGGLTVRPPWNCDPTETSNDDSAADFSNFATLAEDHAHTVAAPGVCINSTFPGGQYATGSGTSFATPIVSGTVALCIASGECAGLTPQQIIAKIVADGESYNNANQGYGFEGDPLHDPDPNKYYGFLVRAALY